MSLYGCLQKVGDSLIDSVIGENIPILTEQEKFNETITSSVKRLESSLTGKSNSYNCLDLGQLCQFHDEICPLRDVLFQS